MSLCSGVDVVGGAIEGVLFHDHFVSCVGDTRKSGDKNSESLNAIQSTVIFSKRRKISSTLNRTQLSSISVSSCFYTTLGVAWVFGDSNHKVSKMFPSS